MIEYKKKSYAMKAEVVAIGTEIYNFLEDCHYTTNEAKCVKLIGTVGEEWPVTLEKLAKTYTLADGTHITQENIPAGVFDIVTRLLNRPRSLPVGVKFSRLTVKAFLMVTATLSSLQTRMVSLTLMIRGLSTAWCSITPMHLLTAKL